MPAKESLAGRIFYFDLDLLSFEEFLELRKKDVKKITGNPNLWKRELRIEMNDYLLKPFPEIVNFPDEMAKKYLKESIVEKVILKDLSGLFEVREIEAIEKIIAVIGSEPGLIMNLEDMSKDFGIGRQALSNYLYYLQCCFLIRQLKNFRGSFKAASRKLKKYYLLHPCFSLAYGSETGKIMENLVAFKTKSDYYWREGGKEVDFIVRNGGIMPVEVKYKKQVKRKDMKNLASFMDLFKTKEALMITDDTEGKERANGKTIKLVPLWKFLLQK
ncbi:MAG: ATP-binding protein [Candidatus Aenigmarchaeota archaeon]|nr:ATP-binding protein [Candidatus Aenigmarchaeota archaeon]